MSKLFLKFLRCQSSMNTHCRFTSCPLILNLTPVFGTKRAQNKLIQSVVVQLLCKLVGGDRKTQRCVRKNKSGVLLCIACSVFCTMKRLMTGCFFCAYKTTRSVKALKIPCWWWLSLCHIQCVKRASRCYNCAYLRHFLFPQVNGLNPEAQWQSTLDISAIWLLVVA